MKIFGNNTQRFDLLIRVVIIFVSVALPRIAVLGGLPSTDEGLYAFFSQLANASLAAGQGLPHGMLMLYPILVSWTFEFSINHLIFLRTVDMFCAIAAGWIFYKIIEIESRSKIAAALISFIFLFTLNHPTFIQSGFKNSYFAAYIPLFLSVRIAQTVERSGCWRWMAVGGLVALSVLLRETFVTFAVVGALAILFAQGWRACLQFCVGGMVVGILIVAVMLCARGDVSSLIDAYSEVDVIYKSMQNLTIPLFFASGETAAREMRTALCLSAASIAVIGAAIYFSPSQLKNLGRIWFWIAATLVPLLEPLTKIGFPYHFSVCLLGLAGLSAIAWQMLTVDGSREIRAGLATVVLGMAAASLFLKFIPLEATWRRTRVNVENWDSNSWVPSSVSQSNYLIAADAIRKNAMPGNRLVVSGFMFALYPLTDLLPPEYELRDLSLLVIKLGPDENEVKDALLGCLPDIVMTTSRTDQPGGDAISAAVENTGQFRAVAVVPVSPDRSYGSFGGTVYKRVNGAATSACIDPTENAYGAGR